jgi:spoIIIJ-associated protein
MEIIVKAKTVEEAVKLGAEKLGKSEAEVKYAVIEEAKKGFLGMFSSEAEVKVYTDEEGEIAEESVVEAATEDFEEVEEAATEAASEELPPVQVKVVEFLNTVIGDMGVEAVANVTRIDERLAENSKTYEKDIHIEITGKGLGMLIGRHGDVLDSLQYLCNIVVGRYPKRGDKHEYIRIVLDIENYREKRADTLKTLARRMASKVVATGRNFTLEPMSSYERRIIHSELQSFKGVHTYSVGTENNRRVVIAYGDDVSEDYDN